MYLNTHHLTLNGLRLVHTLTGRLATPSVRSRKWHNYALNSHVQMGIFCIWLYLFCKTFIIIIVLLLFTIFIFYSNLYLHVYLIELLKPIKHLFFFLNVPMKNAEQPVGGAKNINQ